MRPKRLLIVKYVRETNELRGTPSGSIATDMGSLLTTVKILDYGPECTYLEHTICIAIETAMTMTYSDESRDENSSAHAQGMGAKTAAMQIELMIRDFRENGLDG